MSKIGIFFGTDTGSTRLIAKMMSKKLGEEFADKPLNVNRISVDDMLRYDTLILGTPSYGEGRLPGKSTGIAAGSWEEFLPQLEGKDLSGKLVAFYGLGNQEKYPERFADAMVQLYEQFAARGAEVVGAWSTEGYEFESSKSVVDGRFVGLVLDQNSQRLLTEERVEVWLDMIKPQFLAKLDAAASVTV